MLSGLQRSSQPGSPRGKTTILQMGCSLGEGPPTLPPCSESCLLISTYLLTAIQRSADQPRASLPGEGIGQQTGSGCPLGVPARWHLCFHGARGSRWSLFRLSVHQLSGGNSGVLPGGEGAMPAGRPVLLVQRLKGRLVCYCPFWSVGGALIPSLPAGLAFA